MKRIMEMRLFKDKINKVKCNSHFRKKIYNLDVMSIPCHCFNSKSHS